MAFVLPAAARLLYQNSFHIPISGARAYNKKSAGRTQLRNVRGGKFFLTYLERMQCRKQVVQASVPATDAGTEACTTVKKLLGRCMRTFAIKKTVRTT